MRERRQPPVRKDFFGLRIAKKSVKGTKPWIISVTPGPTTGGHEMLIASRAIHSQKMSSFIPPAS